MTLRSYRLISWSTNEWAGPTHSRLSQKLVRRRFLLFRIFLPSRRRIASGSIGGSDNAGRHFLSHGGSGGYFGKSAVTVGLAYGAAELRCCPLAGGAGGCSVVWEVAGAAPSPVSSKSSVSLIPPAFTWTCLQTLGHEGNVCDLRPCAVTPIRRSSADQSPHVLSGSHIPAAASSLLFFTCFVCVREEHVARASAFPAEADKTRVYSP